jgi:hypothetical protein
VTARTKELLEDIIFRCDCGRLVRYFGTRREILESACWAGWVMSDQTVQCPQCRRDYEASFEAVAAEGFVGVNDRVREEVER